MLKKITRIAFPSIFLFCTSVHAVEHQTENPNFLNQYGISAENRLNELNSLISRNKNATDSTKTLIINQYINSYTFSPDTLIWGKLDYWAQPLQFIGVGGGDCEDFALTKYIVLLKMGIPDSNLKLDYVHKMPSKADHMVLLYSSDRDSPLSNWDVLDNETNKVDTLSNRHDLSSVFAFNYSTLFSLSSPKHSIIEKELLIKFFDYTHKKNVLPPPINPIFKKIENDLYHKEK
ncbi:transglutaminase-like cysteine peptidase [Photobacterium damselae]|uniref:transglutaminase-like cysteine peptidase n=1 Tax=Photobacterium damselae TaxID=38293 RepID=UPI0040685DAE